MIKEIQIFFLCTLEIFEDRKRRNKKIENLRKFFEGENSFFYQ